MGSEGSRVQGSVLGTATLRAESETGSIVTIGAPTCKLASLYIYPVKSLRGVRVDEIAIANGRLVGDRDWVVDRDGNFMHQRDYPQMARIEATLMAAGVSVRTAELGPLEV